MRRILSKIFNRIVLTSLIFLLQVFIITSEITYLKNYSAYIGMGMTALSILIVIFILYKDTNPAVKLAWIVPILAFPVFGGFLYLFFGHIFVRPRLKKNMDRISSVVDESMKQETCVCERLKEDEEDNVSLQCGYISKYAPAPVWDNSAAEYFDNGSSYLESLLCELKKAEKFIFIEYFIIGQGEMWNSVLEVLKEKAARGVTVRIIYDDFGSAMVLPNKYYNTLAEYGIDCISFNRLNPFISIILNNRDHRKIVVIDGKTGFTGGINLADEYINKKERFGYWKDAGLKIEGRAVWNMTVLFLQMWNAGGRTDEDFERYRCENTISKGQGFVQPYGDSPLDSELVGENVYLNIINNARKYLWIYTPYLIMDNVMMESLKLACKRGVDVRIVTPGIPDKKMVYYMTRCSYKPLMDVGARIYEYTPGFIHSKCTLCDDCIVDIGTVNYDYRSLYHHFECGVLLYGTPVSNTLKDDMCRTFEVSRLIAPDDLRTVRLNLNYAVMGPLLHLFAPLL